MEDLGGAAQDLLGRKLLAHALLCRGAGSCAAPSSCQHTKALLALSLGGAGHQHQPQAHLEVAELRDLLLACLDISLAAPEVLQVSVGALPAFVTRALRMWC